MPISALTNLGVNNLAGFLSFYMGTKALDANRRMLFEADVSQTDSPKIGDLVDFVQRRCVLLESIQDRNVVGLDQRHSKFKYNTIIKTILAASTNLSTECQKCLFCSVAHPAYRCQVFKKLPIE